MKYHVFGGGTVSHVRPHLALCAPAYGGTARYIAKYLRNLGETNVQLQLTKMANRDSVLETNDDVREVLKEIVRDPEPCVIFMTAALCDYTGDVDSGAEEETSNPLSKQRLKTSAGDQSLTITPADKLINNIRSERKDIFLVGFKTTTGCTERDMFMAGLNLLKRASCNLVLVNDLHTGLNLIVTPEVAPYGKGFPRDKILRELVQMTVARSGLTFLPTNIQGPVSHTNACSTVAGSIFDDECLCGASQRKEEIGLMEWSKAPETLTRVVDHCVKNGAYKAFNNVTVGHFGYRESFSYMDMVSHGKDKLMTFWSSRRKKNFNIREDRDLVCVGVYNDYVRAVQKPSAGARSQAQLFFDHPEYDCVVHFHCPLKDPWALDIPVRSQRELECGSKECGINTSGGMIEFFLERPQYRRGFNYKASFATVKVVMLDKHGPNILFKSTDDWDLIVDFIDQNFALNRSTSEYL